MNEPLDYNFLATELESKALGLGNLGAKLKFVFEGDGVVHIDATGEQPVITRDPSLPADFVITAPLQVWIDLRAKKIAPHVAAMTRRLKFQGDMVTGMKLTPRIMSVL